MTVPEKWASFGERQLSSDRTQTFGLLALNFLEAQSQLFGLHLCHSSIVDPGGRMSRLLCPKLCGTCSVFCGPNADRAYR
jgi:hypothetical protein